MLRLYGVKLDGLENDVGEYWSFFNVYIDILDDYGEEELGGDVEREEGEDGV